ncbi:MAG: hypothetical protein AABN34_29515 [Acidobacteriota bacterium]
MSQKSIDNPEINDDVSVWGMLLEETKAEIRASEKLTDEEKRLLDEMDELSDDEWEPITVSESPLSETIIADRGERY